MLFLCLSRLMSYSSICFILKQYVFLFMTYLPIPHLRISVIFLLVHLTFIHITLDFLVLEIYININKSRLTIRLNSFSIFGAKLWNCLRPNLRNLGKKPFKNKITSIFTWGTWKRGWLCWGLYINVKNCIVLIIINQTLVAIIIDFFCSISYYRFLLFSCKSLLFVNICVYLFILFFYLPDFNNDIFCWILL